LRLLRKIGLASVLFLVLLSMTGAQSFALPRVARFQASLAGTYSTAATITESGCDAGADANGHPLPIPPVTASVSDREMFTSVAPTPIRIQQIAGSRLSAGRVRRPMMLRVIAHRADGLSSVGAVTGCRPPTPLDHSASCGTRIHTFLGDIVGGDQGFELGFAFMGKGGTPVSPEDIFTDCPLAQGQSWLGKLGVPTAPVSASAIFNRHQHTLIITGGRSGEFNLHRGNIASVGQFNESYTLTLRRIQ
jgi:hypothetical protein